MPSVKITQLPILNQLSANNANTVFVAVDKTSNTTSQFPTNTLAAGLFANNILNVGTQVPSSFPGLIAQFVADEAPYGQVNFENANTEGSMDIVITADIGDDANNFLDLGMNNSGYADPQYSSMKGADGYLFVNGSQGNDYVGNLVIGTTAAETNVLFSVGGTTNLDVVAKMTKNGLMFDNGGYITFDDGTQITSTNYNQVTNIASEAAANTVVLQGTNATQNTRLNSIETINTNQNTSISIIQGVDLTQNTNITAVNDYAASGYAKANAALANTTGIFAGSLTFTGGITVNNTINGSNVSLGNQIQFTSNATIRTASGTGNEKDILILTGDELSTTNGGSITVRTGAGTANGKGGNINLISGFGGLGRGTINLFGNTVSNGTFNVLNSNFDANSSLINISAADDASVYQPSNSYYMMHITGKSNNVTRVVFDSFGANTYPLLSGRMGRGSAAAPAAAANNDVLMRVVGNGFTGTQFPSSSPSKIDFVAAENFSDANRGTRIEFWNTPAGSNNIQRIATFNANEVSFTGAVNPQKGFIYAPVIYPGAQTAITIDMSDGPLVRAQTSTGLTVTLSNFIVGKGIDLWVTNISGGPATFTHGVSAINSTIGSASYNIPGGSTIAARYVCLDGTLANTMCSIIHN